MAILYIVKYGNPVLREKAEPISEMTDELRKLIADMFDTMYDAPGVGLAAPQVGVAKQLFVMDPAGNRDEFDSDPRVIINPEVLDESPEDERMEEGCLSLPEMKGDVYRPLTIRVKYQDENLEPHEETLEDFYARVFLHEYDHLQGVLFFDHMSLPVRTTYGPALMRIKAVGQKEEKLYSSSGEPPPYTLESTPEDKTPLTE
jgi:peptide deformylase